MTLTVLDAGIIDADPDTFSLDTPLRPVDNHQVKLTISTSADRAGAKISLAGEDLHRDAISETNIDIALAATTPVETTLKFASVNVAGISVAGMTNDDTVTITQPFTVVKGGVVEALFNAVRTRYKGIASVDQLTEIYNTEADAEAKHPYGVFQLITGSPDNFASNKKYLENCLIQFNLFDKHPDSKRLLAAYTALTKRFDFAALSITGFTALSCVRGPTIQTKVEGVWQINVSYRMKAK